MVADLTTVELGDESCRVHARGKFSDKDANDYVPNAESNRLHVDVPFFEGPFDLLLHLIKKHSMDIFDIPIVLITQKYLEALDEMQSLDLDLAGEFLVMAATLMQIKSKMLLPPDEQAAVSGEEEAEDPRAELMRRLIEYQKFKEIAADLEQRNQLGADTFARGLDDYHFGIVPEPLEETEGIPLANIEVFELIEIFAQAIDQAKPKFAHSVQFEKISVRARMTELLEFSRSQPQFNFMDLLRFFKAASKIEIIVTFLAVLEMAKLKLISVEQDFQSRDIKIASIQENVWNDLTDLPGEIV